MSESISKEKGLLLDWKYRPRTWGKLTLFVLAALLLHVVCFFLFSIRPSRLTRAVPAPFSVATTRIANDVAGQDSALLELGLPEVSSIPRYESSYQNYQVPRQPWPVRDESVAWPEISGVSQFVLPPEKAVLPPHQPESSSPEPK